MPDIIPLDLPASYWRGKAQQAQKNGSYPEAVRLYRAALRKHDDNAIRRDLARTYADMRCLTASDRLYLENLARDAGDSDSLYGLARNRSLAGDEQSMADLLDLYLRLAPCGEQADQARDILWQLPRERRGRRRLRRAETRYHQAMDVQGDPAESLRRARQSWSRGKTAATARLLSQLYMQLDQKPQTLKYALIACQMAPNDLTARQLLATALHENGMAHGCRAALRQAAALCTGMEQLPIFCSCALYLKQPDIAAELVENKLRQYPHSTDLMLLEAMLLREMPDGANRAEELIAAVRALDEENPMTDLMEADWQDERGIQERLNSVLRQVLRLQAFQNGQDDKAHEEIVHLMRMPFPGMVETAANLFLNTEDVLGMRMALTEAELPPMLCGLMLSSLERHGQALPVFARVEGRLALVPQRPRPPYDADLHDLIRALLRHLPDPITLDQVTRQVPPLWRSLPLSARRHCAQSGDTVWPTAFTACLLLQNGGADAARALINKSPCPRRVRRACMQLIRRSKKPYEVHRF